MTVKEIADASGVSTATVSRVLNNGPVKKETKEKVEAAIRSMNHIPDDLTKTVLATAQKAYAIVTHSVTNYFSMEFVETVINRCEKNDILVYVNRSDTYDAQYKSICDLLSRGVEGIILHDPPLSEYDPEFLKKLSQRIPLVLVHSDPRIFDINAVMVDQEFGMRRATRFLLDQGLTRQLFVRGETGFSFDLKQRVWEEELKVAGVYSDEQQVLVIKGADREMGVEASYNQVFEALQGKNHPNAIFTCNDIMGVGALRAIEDAGLKVPQDISLLSHDNTILGSNFKISSVDLKISSLAHAALDLLDYAISGEDNEPRKILITPDLNLRSTTK
ncbi:MAG: LacI family DNA-binding transcriptional regulator [Pleomorphochaeta sp.]